MMAPKQLKQFTNVRYKTSKYYIEGWPKKFTTNQSADTATRECEVNSLDTHAAWTWLFLIYSLLTANELVADDVSQSIIDEEANMLTLICSNAYN